MVKEREDKGKRQVSSSPIPPPSGRPHNNYVNFDIAQIMIKQSHNDNKEEESISKSSGTCPGLLSPSHNCTLGFKLVIGCVIAP